MAKTGEKNKGGRPSVVTPEVIKKLTDAFMLDLNATQACMQAGISTEVYYNLLKRHPEFVNFFKQCRENLKIKAKYAIARSIPFDPALALKYLKLRSNEFKEKHDHSGDMGSPQNTKLSDLITVKKAMKESLEELKKQVIDGTD